MGLPNDVCTLLKVSGRHQNKAKVIGFVLKKVSYLHNTTLPLPLLTPPTHDLERDSLSEEVEI